MKVRETLAEARAILAGNNVEDASLEGELLLRHVMGLDRTRFFLNLDCNLSSSEETSLRNALERRLSGEPTAYIRGYREFYGLDFQVNRNVLIPRPETELLVDKAIDMARAGGMKTLADIGTGCGAVAICLALALPQAVIYATDISAAALDIARENCRRHGVTDKIRLLQGDLLEALPGPVDLIAANLPYVAAGDMPAYGPLSYEPETALSGGPVGTELILRLCDTVGNRLSAGGCLLLEVGQGQTEAVIEQLRRKFPGAGLEAKPDLSGISRVVSLCLTRVIT